MLRAHLGPDRPSGTPAGGCGTAYGVPDRLVDELLVLDGLDELVVDGLDVDVDDPLSDVDGELVGLDEGGVVVPGELDDVVGGSVVGDHVVAGAVVGDDDGGGTGRVVDDVGGAVRAPGSRLPGGVSLGSAGAVDGGDDGVQPSGIDPAGIGTVPDVAPPPEPPKGMTDEKASIADAAVRAQLTPSGVVPPL